MTQLDERTVPPGTWTRDESHQVVPMVPLWASVWCEPYTRGFADAFARWGYLGDGLAATTIGGWGYMSFRPLADPGLVPVRIARAAEAAARDEHLAAARDWAEVTGPGFERQRLRLATATADAGPDRLDAVARLVREVVRSRFAAVGIHELVIEWVLHAGERLGWDRGQALAAAAEPRRLLSPELAAVVAAVAAVPALVARFDAADPPAPAELRADPAVAAALDHYLVRHGDALLELDLSEPTVAERPERWPDIVAAAWTRRGVVPVPDPPGLDDADRAVLARARVAYPLRDDGGELLQRCLGLLRRVALDAGGRLGLPAREDALLLTAEELIAALRDGHADPALLDTRREQHRRAKAGPPPPVLGDPPQARTGPSPQLPAPAARAMQRLGVFVELMEGTTRAPADGPDLTGLPASAGRYEGVVRVVLDADDAHTVEPGEVLVCHVTAPAWNLAMARAGALVCEVGGPLSHAAITAREFGIPAVVGCRGATAQLRTGDRVAVDGSGGTVRRF